MTRNAKLVAAGAIISLLAVGALMVTALMASPWFALWFIQMASGPSEADLKPFVLSVPVPAGMSCSSPVYFEGGGDAEKSESRSCSLRPVRTSLCDEEMAALQARGWTVLIYAPTAQERPSLYQASTWPSAAINIDPTQVYVSRASNLADAIARTTRTARVTCYPVSGMGDGYVSVDWDR